MELLGQAALVTGAARGIGKAIAQRFAHEGADVAIVDRDGELAGAVADELKALGRRVFVAVADVSSCAQIRKAVEAAASAFGRLDICVNNAGIGKSQPFLEVTGDDWERHIGIHLSGTFYCSQAAAREMVKRHYGRIINLASVAGLMGPIDMVPYGSAKAGIVGLTRAVALDLADYGITVNAIAPGPIDTEILNHWPADTLRERAQHLPIARLGQVEEIAHAAQFLASPRSGFITGTVVTIDGGSVAAGAYMVEKCRRRKAAG